MAKILVVEDERMIAEDLLANLEDMGHQGTGIAADYNSAITSIRKLPPDLVLLDIRLQGERDGIELAQELVDRFRLPVIYLSSNSDSHTLQRAFQTSPQAFLTKPFNKNDLAVAIELAVHNSGRPTHEINVIDNALFVRKTDRFIKVPFRDILYIKSEGSYCCIHTLRDQHTLSINSQRFLDIVKHHIFQRIHRSYIVNMNNVESFSSTSISVGPQEIPMSKNHYADFAGMVKKI